MALLPSVFKANTGRCFLSLQGIPRRDLGPGVETHDTRRLQMGHSRTTRKVQEPWKAQADGATECENSWKTIKGWGRGQGQWMRGFCHCQGCTKSLCFGLDLRKTTGRQRLLRPQSLHQSEWSLLNPLKFPNYFNLKNKQEYA